jgi:hypothetical protein
MPRATTAVTLLVSLAVGTACSSGPEITASGPPAASSAKPTATASPLDGLSSDEVMAKVEANVKKAKSVHVTARYPREGKGEPEFVFNFKLTDTGKAVGSYRSGTDRVWIRRLGKVLYFKANRSFWDEDGSEPPADALAGRWIKERLGSKNDNESFFEITDFDDTLNEAMHFADEEAESQAWAGEDREPLILVPGVEVGGQPTIGLADTKVGEETKESGTLYVSSTGPTLPLHLKVGLDGTEYVKFRSWNKPFRVTAPKGAISWDD